MEQKMWMARFVLEACKCNGPFIPFSFNCIVIMMVSEDHVSSNVLKNNCKTV